jgi:hypothetical protein
LLGGVAWRSGLIARSLPCQERQRDWPCALDNVTPPSARWHSLATRRFTNSRPRVQSRSDASIGGLKALMPSPRCLISSKAVWPVCTQFCSQSAFIKHRPSSRPCANLPCTLTPKSPPPLAPTSPSASSAVSATLAQAVPSIPRMVCCSARTRQM